MDQYKKGWYQVAFLSKIEKELSRVRIGSRQLILVHTQTQGSLRAFRGACPHRGADLALGGHLQNDDIICPFHGYRVGLGRASEDGFSASEFPTLCVGGMVFAQLSPSPEDTAWPRYIRELERDHELVEGFSLNIRAPMETVIENAFDQRHFAAVHGVLTSAFAVRRGSAGQLVADSTFFLPTRVEEVHSSHLAPAQYTAQVFSPGIAAVELIGQDRYTIITCATTVDQNECMVWLTLALPRCHNGEHSSSGNPEKLIQRCRRGMEQDRIIWENLDRNMPPLWTSEDAFVREFYTFCQGFRRK